MKKDVKIGLLTVLCSFAMLFFIGFDVAAADISDLTVQFVGENCVITKCDAAAAGELIIPAKISGKAVTHIGEKAFNKCKELTRIVLPDTVVEIGNEAFSACLKLTEFEMTDSVQRLGKSVFSECSNLERVTLSDNISSLPVGTFYMCEQLEKVNIPDKARVLGENSFLGCSMLKNVVVPEGVISISARCFSNCRSLQTVCLPATIESIYEDAFEKCTALNLLYYTSHETSLHKVEISTGNEYLIQAEHVYNHNHFTSSCVVTVQASCTQPGYSIYDCCCGYSGIGDYVEAKGHDLSVLKTVKPAGCLTKGTAQLECADCSYYEAVSVPAKGHTVVSDKAVKATCTSSGKTQGSHCSACGLVLTEQKKTPAAEHDFSLKIKDNKHLASKATYKKAAKYYYSCSSCGKISENKTFTGNKLVLDKVEKISFSSSTKSVTLKWSKVGSVRGYAVYRKASDGEWKLYKRVRTNTVEIDGLSYGKTYTFAVRAYVLENDSIVYAPEYTSLKTATKPLSPSGITAKQNQKSITLTWNKSKGATGYRVYKYDTKAQKWIIVKSKTTACKLTLKNLESGRRYKFSVRAYTDTGKKLVWSERSKGFITSTKPASPVIKATSYKYSVKLEWKKIKFADGYVVYYSDAPNSGYKKLATTSKLYCKKDKLESGKTYYFKVYSYRKVSGERVYSYASDIKKVKTR